jgi:polysaccharide export outer membrane protein
MDGHQENTSRVMRGIPAVCALLLTGCSLASPFGNGPPRNPMLQSTKELREDARGTLPLPRELEKQPLPPYIVEPGDVLLVQTADLDSPFRLPGDQPVLLDGTINLGRFGRLPVAGKTVDEIENMIRATVQAQSSGKDIGFITVRLITRVSKVYYVLGEVNSPGAFNLAGRETVLDGILAAGGLTDRASRNNIVLSRPTHPHSGRAVLPICYNQIVQLGDTTTNYQLAPGDRIFVASKTCREQHHGYRDRSECNGPQFSAPWPHKKDGLAPAPGGVAPPPDVMPPGLPMPAPATIEPGFRAPIFRNSPRTGA